MFILGFLLVNIVINALDIDTKIQIHRYHKFGKRTNGYSIAVGHLLEPEIKKKIVCPVYTYQNILPYCEPNGKSNKNSTIKNMTIYTTKLQVGQSVHMPSSASQTHWIRDEVGWGSLQWLGIPAWELQAAWK